MRSSRARLLGSHSPRLAAMMAYYFRSLLLAQFEVVNRNHFNGGEGACQEVLSLTGQLD